MRYPHYLLGIFLLYWVAMAIAPLNRFNWALENILVVLFVGGLVLTYRRFQFSNASYTFMVFFLMFHVLGSHYSYSDVPLLTTLWELLESRNHFDRIAHFLFGLCFALPIAEVLHRGVTCSRRWMIFLVLMVVMALAGIYEILEWASGYVLSPEDISNFLGMQGDMWDAQKDMALAFFGALLPLPLLKRIRPSRRASS